VLRAIPVRAVREFSTGAIVEIKLRAVGDHDFIQLGVLGARRGPGLSDEHEVAASRQPAALRRPRDLEDLRMNALGRQQLRHRR
jgi:hypothetical protein